MVSDHHAVATEAGPRELMSEQPVEVIAIATTSMIREW
jgi:hypothetical protein